MTYVSEAVAGRLGAQADVARAKEMYAQGTDGQTVFDETGFFQGPDGIYRTNLSDQNLELTGELDDGETLPLDQVIEHPELFEAMAGHELPTVQADSSYDGRGAFYPETNHIILQDENDLEALAHEDQHWIETELDYPEGSIGSNPELAGGDWNYMNDFGELEATDTHENIGQEPPETPELLRVAEEGGYDQTSPSVGQGPSMSMS